VQYVSGSYYDLAGGLHGERGYTGCIQNLLLDGTLRLGIQLTNITTVCDKIQDASCILYVVAAIL
jgi:hypothetical protein